MVATFHQPSVFRACVPLKLFSWGPVLKDAHSERPLMRLHIRVFILMVDRLLVRRLLILIGYELILVHFVLPLSNLTLIIWAHHTDSVRLHHWLLIILLSQLNSPHVATHHSWLEFISFILTISRLRLHFIPPALGQVNPGSSGPKFDAAFYVGVWLRSWDDHSVRGSRVARGRLLRCRWQSVVRVRNHCAPCDKLLGLWGLGIIVRIHYGLLI